MHVHNIFPTLSPSIFRTCAAAGVPTVHTLHNFRIQCASATLYREGQVCEECVQQNSFMPGVSHACYRGSRLGSAVSGAGMALHAYLGTWTSSIDAYIALTEFSANKLGSYRIPRDKVHVKPNFTEDTGLRVKGFQSRVEILHWMRHAKILLLTSLWFEAGLPLVAIEAFSLGLPVVAADIASTGEFVRAGRSGWLFSPGDAEACAAALREAVRSPDAYEERRQRARAFYEIHHTPEANYEQLMRIYARAGARG